jgi:hypothetical protein
MAHADSGEMGLFMFANLQLSKMLHENSIFR